MANIVYPPPPTLFGVLKHAYDKACTSVGTKRKAVTCTITTIKTAIDTYFNTKIISPAEQATIMDQKAKMTEKGKEYIDKLDALTADMTTIATDAVNWAIDTANAPQDPNEPLRSLFNIEKIIRELIENQLEIPSIDFKSMNRLLDIDAKFANSKLNKLINYAFSFYKKNVHVTNDLPNATRNQTLLFLGYLFCAPDTENKTTPIPYGYILEDTRELTDEDIDNEYKNICAFEKDADVDDSNQKNYTGNNYTTRIIDGVTYNDLRYSEPPTTKLTAEEYAILKAKMAEKAHAEDLNNGTDVDSDEDERVTKRRHVGDNTTGGKRKSNKRRITKKKKHIKRKATKKKKYSKPKTKRKVHKKK